MENSEFWNELCGTHAYKVLGLEEINEKNVKTFDDWYFMKYPYLTRYIGNDDLRTKSVLEIGLGFGTVGEYVFLKSKSYTGVDLAENPVRMMEQRIIWKNKCDSAYTKVADATKLPFPDSSFDVVISIGCLHHTGDISKSVSEVHRVLKDSGRAMVMLYNKDSYRRFFLPFGIYYYEVVGKNQPELQ